MAQPEMLQFHPFLPPALLAAAAVMLLLSVRRSYVRTTRRVSGGRRALLGLLRAAACAAVLACLARPVLVQQRELREPGLCFIALDSSASMDLRDTTGGRTRWETAGDILTAQRRELSRLRTTLELQRYVFDSHVQRTATLPGEAGAAGASPAGSDGTAGLGPHGLSTDLALLLETIAAEAGGSPGASAIIISDGRQNVPKDVIPAALALERAGVPLYCIGLGQEATPAEYKDIRVRDLIVPEKAFVGTRMVFRVEIASALPAPQVVPLTVEVDGKRIHEGKVSLAQGNNVPAPAVEVSYVPDTLGVHRVVATAGSVPGEVDTANNTRHALFRVYRSKLGIWYVEGAIRKEYGAVCSALRTAPNMQLQALNAYNVRTSTPAELLPRRAEEWAGLRLVVIGDLPAARFENEALQGVAKFVGDGGAVLMIAGASNLGAGGWEHSPLAPVLPVSMTANDGVHNGPLEIALVAREAAHPVLAIGNTAAESAALWKLLPPVPVVSRIAGIRPAGHVLLFAGTSELLIVQEYGKGRSAVFTADATWQWALKANQGETQKRFWRNLATWLTRSDYRDTDKAVFADAERLQYRVGEEAALRAVVHETEKAGAALKRARIAVALNRLQNEVEAPVFKEDVGVGPGEYAKQFALGVPGGYRFRAEALADDGRVIDSDSVDIQVTAPDLEHDNPKANLSLLRRIAALSGGMYFDPEHAGEAFQAVWRRQAGYQKTVTDVTDLWSHPWMLAVFIALLTLEWTLRKRWNLV